MNEQDSREFFTKARGQAVAARKAAQSLKFRLIEKTAAGERDITNEHFRHLQDSIDEYQRVIDSI